MKKIVIDTNILVSGLLFGGKPGELVALWKRALFVPICSKAIIEEYLRVLAYPKFQLSESDIEFILHREILLYFQVLSVKPGKPFVTVDPSDDKFIRCALDGDAELIVFGDEHPLKLSPSPVPIVAVTMFIEKYL